MKMVMVPSIVVIFFISTVFVQSKINPEQKIEKKKFGKLNDGREVYIYNLKNKLGAEARIINYGATVVSLTMPDRNGKFSDIVLGYDSFDSYFNGSSYFGAVVGRYANRIAKGKITLAGKVYQLSVNEGKNELHGGKVGFDKVLWKAEPLETKQGPALKLTYISPDGEMGYPGTVTLNVTYTLTNKNELEIQYEGTTDKMTILNPSNHSYFNLTGDWRNNILSHILQINANLYTPIDKEFIPTGKIEKVSGTPLDFRKPTAIGARINDNFKQLQLAHGYDFNWVLKNYNGKVREVADVYEPTSGRYMRVFTDQPGLQFYSGNFLDGTQIGKHGIAYNFRTGFALEAQHYPNSPNEPAWPSVLLKPGQVYKQTTIYKFSVK